jgi:hypothetical protein
MTKTKKKKSYVITIKLDCLQYKELINRMMKKQILNKSQFIRSELGL